MYSRQIILTALCIYIPVLLTGCSKPESDAATPSSIGMGSVGNAISGDGLANPTPTVMANWGDLPAGREWGSTAGVDIDPIDGHIWGYERCGASSFGSGVPVNCDNNPVDPIFKFDRN